jgi:hypothetical protein
MFEKKSEVKAEVPYIQRTRAALQRGMGKHTLAALGNLYGHHVMFYNCCAFGIIDGFSDCFSKPRDWTNEEFYSAVALYILEYSDGPYALAATAQQTHIDKILEAIGFEIISKVGNPNTTNTVKLWQGKLSYR